MTIPLGAACAALLGMLLGAPTLKLRGDYLAVVTLGFGEIVRLLVINMSHPVNITQGAQGLGLIDPVHILGVDLGRPWWWRAMRWRRSRCTTTCFWRW